MRIKGYFGRGGAPYIRATIVVEKGASKKALRFLVDTGSGRTIIADRDANLLNLNYSKLRKVEHGVSGIGGKVDTYALDNINILFKTENGLKLERFREIFVLKHKITDKEMERLIKSIPSLLGRDFLNKYRLIADKNEDLVVITDEKVTIGENEKKEELL